MGNCPAQEEHMTELSKRKTRLRFKTDAMIRGRRIIIEAHPLTLTIREEGRRAGYELDWESAYWMACKKAVGR